MDTTPENTHKKFASSLQEPSPDCYPAPDSSHPLPVPYGSDMTEQIEQAIQESPLFKHLDDSDLQALIAASTVQVFEPSTQIIEENQNIHHLYIVLMGRVRVWTKGPRGEVELKTMGPGAYFGEVSLMSGNAATASVEVKTGPAQVVAIEKEALMDLVKRDEKVRKMLQGVTLARAKDTIGKVFK
jgi:CRP/FNR family transcriptional regulator, cyclic AMP receptor protein